MFCQFWQFFDRRKCRKNVEGKCTKIQAKKKLGQKLSQKLQQIPSKNRFKIQNNKGRAPEARVLLFWILYRFFVGICWSFWLGFWPSFFLAWIFWHFPSTFFRHFLRSKSGQNRQTYFWPNRFLDKNMDQIMFENLGPGKSRSRKNRSPGNHKVLKNLRFCPNGDL